MDIKIETGNSVVDQVGKMKITGNVIPEAWFKTIVNSKGKIQLLAIMILADIVYWYRPSEVRDETTQSVSYVKKFKDADYLQRSYSQICEKFHITKKQARDALTVLEELGVVKRVFKTINIAGTTLANVMFLSLNPTVLAKLTFPSDDEKGGGDKNVNTPLQKDNDLVTKLEKAPNKKVLTYTNTSSKTTAEINTSTEPAPFSKSSTNHFVVVEANKVFRDLGLTDSEILAIAKASDFDIAKCKRAKDVFDQHHTPINNVVGWLISAVKGNYHLAKQHTSNHSFTNFDERSRSDEEWQAIEKKLYGATSSA